MCKLSVLQVIQCAVVKYQSPRVSVGTLIKFNEALQKTISNYYGTFDLNDIYTPINNGIDDYSLIIDSDENWIIEYKKPLIKNDLSSDICSKIDLIQTY